jgi:hypothetical protein
MSDVTTLPATNRRKFLTRARAGAAGATMSAKVIAFPSPEQIDELASKVESYDLLVKVALEMLAAARHEYEQVACRPAPQVQS